MWIVIQAYKLRKFNKVILMCRNLLNSIHLSLQKLKPRRKQMLWILRCKIYRQTYSKRFMLLPAWFTPCLLSQLEISSAAHLSTWTASHLRNHEHRLWKTPIILLKNSGQTNWSACALRLTIFHRGLILDAVALCWWNLIRVLTIVLCEMFL